MSQRIGIVCPYNIYRFGGVQETVLAHARHLRSRGYKVVVIAPTPKQIARDQIEGVVTIGKSIELRTPFKTTADFSYTANKTELDKLFKEHQFDLLHFHEPWVPHLSKQILIRAKKKGLKTIATFHAKLPSGVTAKTIKTIMKPYAKPIVPKLDELVAVSEVASKTIKTYTKRRVHIIPNAIEVSVYNPKTVKQHDLTDVDSPSILYVGRLETRKGVEYLIRAVATLNKASKIKPRLIIAGDGPLREKLTELAYTLGIYDVHFLGFVSLEEKLQLLKGCDVFCSPALYGESFGIVLIEAMAMGAPVVAGNNSGYAGVLTSEGAQGLVDPENPKQFAKTLTNYLTDKKLRRKVNKWGLEETKKYHYDVVVDKYEKLYKQLAGEK